MFQAVRISTASIWGVAKNFVPHFDDFVTLVFGRGRAEGRKGEERKEATRIIHKERASPDSPYLV